MNNEEKRAPVQGYAQGIPWEMHLRAYNEYRKRYSAQEALIQGNCRGGFATGELDMFIPGWRDELEELPRLRAALKVAMDALSECQKRGGEYCTETIATEALAAITKLVTTNDPEQPARIDSPNPNP